jgi:hypothetical protein
MICGDFSLMRNWPASMLALAALLLCGTASLRAMAAPQAGSEVPPDATPQIQQVDPSQAAPGAHLTVIIQGSNFSSAATVSALSTAIHVDSSKWISATHLEAELSVGASAQPSTVSLMVSNPAGRAAEAAFTIAAGQAPPPPATPPTPDAPTSPQAPANPAPQINPPAPPAPTAPAAPIGPQVTTVEPAQVAPGFNLDLKVTGKNFAPGAKVSFANPGVRVLKITTLSDTELSVHIKVTFDATPGVASLFVVNPDDSEVEIPFEVVAKGAIKPPAPLAPASPAAPGSPDAQRYSAFHLGSPAEAFQVHGKVKGALVVSAGTIQYQEDGKTLINIAVGDVEEIKTSAVATSTFHITLSSGKVYHFAPGSLRPADARSLVDSLRAALPPASK